MFALLQSIIILFTSFFGLNTAPEIAETTPTVQITDAVTIERAPTTQPALTDVRDTAPVACPTEDAYGLDGKDCVWFSDVGFNYTAHTDGSATYVSHYFPPCPFVSPMRMSPVLTDLSFSGACEWDTDFIYYVWSADDITQNPREIPEIIAQDFR